MDAVDHKIISKLQLDGRTTFKELGELVGYTSMGVKKRIESLQERGVIKVSALLNIKELNVSAAIVMLEIESAEAMNKLLERFRNCPRVVHIFTTLGGYNLIALIVAEDQSTLESISIEKCSLRSNDGIRRSELYPIGTIHYSPFLPVREYLAHKERTISPCNVDCGSCQRYTAQECVGCPATHYYHGPL
ncbi:MAG: AsnC family transcriptional regulator [Candidatus Bathyarchaeota archaeon]|nr:AsnC family transcriptional regulator [Candidatus Bathyarchaeota archaeon]